MNKRKLKNKLFNFLGSFDGKTKTKFKNICGKTGKYDVPNELYQKRTNRKNRVLISWKTVKNNNFTLKQLETFSGGVAVEFVNNDFFDEENQTDPLFLELKDRLGSDETVASIITIRSESGSSSSSIQRQAFEKLVNNTKVTYKGDEVTLKLDNYKDYSIKRIQKGGIGNEKWTGFLFISIKGGQQDVIESNDCEQRIFNPACDFAGYHRVRLFWLSSDIKKDPGKTEWGSGTGTGYCKSRTGRSDQHAGWHFRHGPFQSVGLSLLADLGYSGRGQCWSRR